jgi:hypothetical protein
MPVRGQSGVAGNPGAAAGSVTIRETEELASGKFAISDMLRQCHAIGGQDNGLKEVGFASGQKKTDPNGASRWVG